MSIPTGPETALSRGADFSEQADTVHLKGYGMIKVFRKVGKDDDFEYRATDDLQMNDIERLK